MSSILGCILSKIVDRSKVIYTYTRKIELFWNFDFRCEFSLNSIVWSALSVTVAVSSSPLVFVLKMTPNSTGCTSSRKFEKLADTVIQKIFGHLPLNEIILLWRVQQDETWTHVFSLMSSYEDTSHCVECEGGY